MPESSSCPAGATRREFLRRGGALAGSPWVAAGTVAGAGAGLAEPPSAAAPGQSPGAPVRVMLDVNGRPHAIDVEPRTTLLDALRESLGLTGTKKGCDRGQCGACTVLADGERVLSCLSLAVAQEGVRIVTVEGLGEPAHLHPVQAAFVAEDAFQCGYCTPGQVCSGVALLAEVRRGDASAAGADVRRAGPVALDDAEIRERMSGNLCRCGAYPNIVRALKAAGTSR
jgi:xanthine dehydrogenase YagT iron-sulfur-binding subunit